MSVQELEALFRPKAVALVAPDDGVLAHAVARHLGTLGGVVLRVGAGTGAGAVATLAELATVPELCVIVAEPARLPALVEEAGRRGARAAVLISAHPADEATGAALRELARAHGIRLLGPSGLGVAVPARRLTAGAFRRAPRAGRVALVSQSGTLASAVIDWAARRDVGFSHVAVLGGMADLGLADLGFADLLDYLAGQGDCQAILLAMDGLTDARRFLSAARAASRVKPVIVLRTGRRANEGGGGGTPDAVFDAVFRRAGLLRVHDLEELFDALETLSVAIPVRGDRLAIVANGRGIGRLAADALVDGGGRMARPDSVANPLDLGEDADGPAFAGALRRLQADTAVDAVLLLHAPTALAAAGETAHAVAGAMPGTRVGVLTSWLGERDAERAAGELAMHHVPVFETPDRAVRAFLHLVRFRRNQELLIATPPSVPEDFLPDRAAAGAILAAAAAAANDDGDNDGSSGTGVVVSGGDADALLAAYGIATRRGDGDAEEGLAVRVDEDPLFGPVLMVEGVAALPPLNMALAAEALGRVPGRAPAGDAVALLLVKLSQLVLDHATIAGLSLRVVTGEDGRPRAGGATVRLPPPGRERVPTAIRPYPKDLEHPFALPDGRSFLLRPVLPEDEPALKALFHRLTVDEIRLRFFAPKAELSHTTAARMTQIDYGREMGLAICDPGAPGRAALHGVVHLSCDPDGRRAEFAVMLAHDMAGLGLGPVLMRRILDHPARAGWRKCTGRCWPRTAPCSSCARCWASAAPPCRRTPASSTWRCGSEAPWNPAPIPGGRRATIWARRPAAASTWAGRRSTATSRGGAAGAWRCAGWGATGAAAP